MRLARIVSSIIIVFIFTLGKCVFAECLNNLKTSEWLEYVTKATADQKSGKFTGVDKNGVPLLFEWEKIEVSNPVFLEKLENLSDILVQAYTPVVVKFLRKFPQAVVSVDEFKSIKPIFMSGTNSIDWNFVEEKLKIWSFGYFLNDATVGFGQKDVSWFFVVKEEGGKEPIGFVQFLLTCEYEYGDIKVEYLMLSPAAQHRGIGKLLISSIFKILPFVGISRIILSTLNTNEQATNAYESYGFKKYEDKNQQVCPTSLDYYRVHFEHKVDQSDLLQKEAQKLV